MPTDVLTDARCRALKPADKPYKVFDGGSLFMYVSPTGAKIWRLTYRLDGKAQTMSLGPYPAVSLAEARRKREEVKAALRDGLDPMAPRRATKSLSLKDAHDAYWQGRGNVTDAYKTNVRRCMEMHVWPAIGDMPIAAVTRADLLGPLNKMDQQGLHDYVRKARMWLAQVFSWAVEQEHCQGNPADLIKPERAFGAKEEEHFAALQPDEVGALLARLALEDQDLQSLLACRFLALTWARTKEVRMMTWDEVKGDQWVILGARMKRGRDHVVPLSTQAQAILAKMQERRRGACRWVWPGDRTDERPMSENAVLYLLHRIGYKGRATGHGWRSTASTWANEQGWNPDAIEVQLAHSERNSVRAAYNRAAYLTERRTMLQAWADWLDKQG